jgi:predicted DnaQ family exonuclease/DinG family helicase
MASADTSLVALLTTGPAPGEDRLVEVAAVRVPASGEAREFEQLLRAGRLPPALRELTGLGARELARAARPKEGLRKLLRFCRGSRVVVHDAALFRAFLAEAGTEAPDCAGVLELARIACPGATDYSLEAVAREAGCEADAPFRALPRARLLGRVWTALLDRVAGLPPAALDALCRVADVAGHPLAPALSAAASRAGPLELAADPETGLRALFSDHRKLLQRAQKYDRPEPGEEPVPTDGICRMFSPRGPIGRRLPNYEQRAEQVQMVRAVCEAFNEPRHLLAEAGTGTGKSLAYLLPGIAWACTNQDKVLVSTNTRNLQEQLYRKDLPFLTELLPGRFEPALLKGRRNYLCVRRFLHVMRHFERELPGPAEMGALLPLIAWAAGTESGDLAECNGFLMDAAALGVLPAVVTGPDECAGRGCRFRRRCFVNRARALAQLADVIVVNHALLFAELGLDSPVLPPYRCLVFDEAHNLEDVATEALAVVVDGPSIFRVTNFLYRSRRQGGGSGLLATVMHEASRMPAGGAEATLAAGRAMEAVEEVVQAARQFLETLGEPLQEIPPSVERVMLRECTPGLGPESAAWQAAARLRETVKSLGERVEEVAEPLETAADEEQQFGELADDLRSQVGRLREVCAAAEFVLSQQSEQYVYWLQRETRERATYYSVHAAPLRIGEQVRRFFFDEKRTVIMTSATLQVAGSFDYMLERLGGDEVEAGRVGCLAVGSPFDYDRQALVGVPTFLPDPGGRRVRMFDDELASFLIPLLKRTQGRALVLFTSYSLLDAVYVAVKEPLERSGIMVLAQGHSGSREAITSLFRSVNSSVLLGTRSFWEGVDISGETLSCLVLTKLPFHVFTDPLVRARTEYLRSQGKDPFQHYTLPEAVISFRQGFGRLIRTRTDRGVIVATDRRLVTKGYGRSFLASMPTRHHVFRSREEALDAVASFFGSG